ncbi:uncharacterized protein LOC122256861 [Penaeus japonicus]|uniref:uncharacterized protein LOC122256861 n=1 Tax=Penaeus japonicus TaxID=27405 RepID=UPI001C712313|nr:uncharacterized protein LOC122256861 [Penaeus japonicus]
MATRTLALDDAAGTLPLNDTTREALKDKHPSAREAAPDTMYGGNYIPPPPAIFDRITGEDIRKHALHTHGAAGPSGMDAKAWKNILSHARYGSVANDLCNTIAAMARKMATNTCQDIEAFTACRLIALDKKPGCRPIGVGEVLRRIVGKANMEVTKDDIKAAVGNLQVCAGQKAGCEAAIHAMRTIYNDPDCDAVLLVDAANAFNNINRQAAIHNMKMKCPSLAMYIENLYNQPAKQFICDRHTGNFDTIESAEGTTQGDPVAMAMYAIGLLRLQDHISHEIKPERIEQAKECFKNLDIHINACGEKYLGAVLGTKEAQETFVKSRVEEWIEEIKRLADIAKHEPHAAYTAFTFGIKHKWKFLMRTVPNIGHLLQPIEDTIKRDFIPALSGDHQRGMQMAQEVGASNWLTTLPIKAKGFNLNKQEFFDALTLRYR